MLAIKYRPRTFSELVGQDAVRKSMSYALASGKIAQGFLFSGLRGSGKTSSARILARCLNCEQGISDQPCNQCNSCKNSTDVYELDAASNRGIDAINELIESTKYAPLSARFKIYIIDEVHMLTKEAFNALLKTLEEPPAYVKFILATTDPGKLPATILSRVLHFRFKKIPLNLVSAHLAQICQREGISAQLPALEMIARAGAGSMRDSLTLLDQALLYTGGNLETTALATMLGALDTSAIRELFCSICKGDDAGVQRFINYAREYESKDVLDSIKSYLKEDFYSGKGLFDSATYERFFAILARSYRLASICDDDEFALSLCVLSMAESAFASDYEAPSETEDHSGALYAELLRASSERDAQFGQLLVDFMRFDGMDETTIYLCFNPQTPEHANTFKAAYAAWWKELAGKITQRSIKITSESASKLKNQTPAPMAPTAPNTPTPAPMVARAPVAPTAPAPVVKPAPAPMTAPAAQQGRPAAQSAANTAEDAVAPVYSAPVMKAAAAATSLAHEQAAYAQRFEPELPSYQIDDFDGSIEDDEQDLSDLSASDEAFTGLSDEMIELIFSHIQVLASVQEVSLIVDPPLAEPELSMLRSACKRYVSNLKTIYSQPVVVKKKLI